MCWWKLTTSGSDGQSLIQRVRTKPALQLSPEPYTKSFLLKARNTTAGPNQEVDDITLHVQKNFSSFTVGVNVCYFIISHLKSKNKSQTLLFIFQNIQSFSGTL